MKSISSLLCSLVLVSAGCVTPSPMAAKIALHTERTTQLDKCDKLGPVQAEASGWSAWDNDDWHRQAGYKLREAAARDFPSTDSVVLLNVDQYMTKLVAHGIAYQCSKDQEGQKRIVSPP